MSFAQAFLNIQLYEKALDLFEDDPPNAVSSFLNFNGNLILPGHINKHFLFSMIGSHT